MQKNETELVASLFDIAARPARFFIAGIRIFPPKRGGGGGAKDHCCFDFFHKNLHMFYSPSTRTRVDKRCFSARPTPVRNPGRHKPSHPLALKNRPSKSRVSFEGRRYSLIMKRNLGRRERGRSVRKSPFFSKTLAPAIF